VQALNVSFASRVLLMRYRLNVSQVIVFMCLEPFMYSCAADLRQKSEMYEY